MNAESLINALALPAACMINQRIPKKVLLDHASVSAPDKRLIEEGIEELRWAAVLKPNTIGVPWFSDEVREYLEVAVLTAELRGTPKVARLQELIHRAIPYPVVLWTELAGDAVLSLAHKRWSQGKAGEVVVEELRRSEPVREGASSSSDDQFLYSLGLAGLPHANMFTLYQGYIDRVSATTAATITGAFAIPCDDGQAMIRLGALDAHGQLQRELEALRKQASREPQMNRRVEINLAIQRLEAKRYELEAALRMTHPR